MKEKYRIQFFKYLYDSLGLKQYDDLLVGNGVEAVEGEQNMCSEEMLCKGISPYFYLLNDVDIACLTPEETSYLEGITFDTPASDVQKFLEETYRRVLLNHGESEKVYYGPLENPDYEADKDAIAIGVKYDHFGLSTGKEKDMDQVEREEEIVNGIVRQIQSNPNFKTKIIVYDELHEKLKENDVPVPVI